jgi:hypothetical protein
VALQEILVPTPEYPAHTFLRTLDGNSFDPSAHRPASTGLITDGNGLLTR